MKREHLSRWPGLVRLASKPGIPLARRALFCALALPGLSQACLAAENFDAAPFATPLIEGQGLIWDDPREVHRVVVQFAENAPPPSQVHLEYWGSRWPQQHLPKDHQPGGGDVGWMELGNWFNGGWRRADAVATSDGRRMFFAFAPVDAKEFPDVKPYPADFRYTLKLRLASDQPMPKIEQIQALTDSAIRRQFVRLAWRESGKAGVEASSFNGKVEAVDHPAPRINRLTLQTTTNPDPNTSDRTLVSIRRGPDVFTFALDDLLQGPLFLPRFGVAVLPDNDARDYAAVAAAHEAEGAKTLYDRVAALPEQTWRGAWADMPPKKSRIYFPLGLDGGRERFQVAADGSLRFRSNDQFLENRPGGDTPRLRLEPAPAAFSFGSLPQPVERHIEEDSIPICCTTWETNGVRITQTALVTPLAGTQASGGPPPADAFAVCLLKFIVTNISATTQTAALPLFYSSKEARHLLRPDAAGRLWLGADLRGEVLADRPPFADTDGLVWTWTLAPRESKTFIAKLPYVVLTEKSEQEALQRLNFETERAAVAAYWRPRLDACARLITPEPVLDQFYRANTGHLLINCEREPGHDWRFARVGSFVYGAYGNESCMMVADLDRRGAHQVAQECLDAWLHYQGTVGLPGDFSSQKGVLYGAGGYESGGYNQHHGWILWCLAEHFRFTRDEPWLRQSAPGILAAADWIIRETARTADRQPLERGLLPAGSLEDIGDWWTWLSTSCYTWRGLDSAAWALEQIQHPEAPRVRRAADAFHTSLLHNFRQGAQRSPVVRLRDGVAVPQFPSYVQRRGRSFGWICETLEGAMHLLITGALDARSEEARWILEDYEDNLFLSNQYGYMLDHFDRDWFGRGGMSMQACLLLDVEPYLARDDVKNALRAMFNAIAVSHFPDVHMNTEHALPEMGDWRGDHYKSSDEANACGWLRQIFLREEGDTLLLGQAVPREWLSPGQHCGFERGATYFGPASIVYSAGHNEICAQVDAPRRNPPRAVRLRFRTPDGHPLRSVTVNGKPWRQFKGEWVELPGAIGTATVVAHYAG